METMAVNATASSKGISEAFGFVIATTNATKLMCSFEYAAMIENGCKINLTSTVELLVAKTASL